MIRISRSKLSELAGIFMLANTPYSLVKEMQKSETINNLKNECSYKKLVEYYNDITTRAKQTDVSIGLAYAVMISILTFNNKKLDDLKLKIDEDRLQWGKEIKEFLTKTFPAQTIITVDNGFKVKENYYQDSGSETRIQSQGNGKS